MKIQTDLKNTKKQQYRKTILYIWFFNIFKVSMSYQKLFQSFVENK